MFRLLIQPYSKSIRIGDEKADQAENSCGLFFLIVKKKEIFNKEKSSNPFGFTSLLVKSITNVVHAGWLRIIKNDFRDGSWTRD